MTIQIKKQIIANHLGNDIIEHTLTNSTGFTVKILNYGGIITEILAPDKDGNFANVVLNNQPFDPANIPHYGAIVGRIAGRIRNSKFELNGKVYSLAENRKSVTLHGGKIGLDKRIWTVTYLEDGIKLSYCSPDGEEGFPGNAQIEVSYIIDEDNQLTLHYHAISDQDTILNLTNHSYFDLTAGDDAHRMTLKLPADYFGEIDNISCFTGNLLAVDNTPFDFRVAKPIKQDIAQDNQQLTIVNGGYDHPFVIDNSQAIILHDPVSGRRMQVTTTEDCCVVYSANWLAKKHAAICLETQRMPDAINLANYCDSVILRTGKTYSGTTIWSFGVGDDIL